MTLPATTDCAASGAICTGEGRPLSEAVSVTVAQEIETEIVIPLTVSLIDVPHEHDGSTAVVFEVRFSRSPTGFSFRTLRDETLQVTQGETVVTPGVRRMEQGSNRRWEVTVEQASGVEDRRHLGRDRADERLRGPRGRLRRRTDALERRDGDHPRAAGPLRCGRAGRGRGWMRRSTSTSR